MGNTITQAPHSTRIWMTYNGRVNFQKSTSLYLPMPRIIAGIPSMGMIQLIQAAVTQATATAVGSNPMLTQAEMAMGANTNREPKLAPVTVSLRLVSSVNTNTMTNGLTLVPKAPATASPTMAVKPEFAKAPATPMTPAIIRISGEAILLRTSLKLRMPKTNSTAAMTPGMA